MPLRSGGPIDLGEDLQRLPPLTLQGLTQHGLGLAVRVGVGGVECGNADIAAVVFLAAYAVPILHPDLPSWLLDLCRSLSWITWGIFVVDIVVRLSLADERLRYLVRHWYDVLIPLVSMLSWRPKIRLRGRVGVYIAGGDPPLAFCAALAVLDPERSSPMPTSATWTTRSGGRAAPWRPLVTATANGATGVMAAPQLRVLGVGRPPSMFWSLRRHERYS